MTSPQFRRALRSAVPALALGLAAPLALAPVASSAAPTSVTTADRPAFYEPPAELVGQSGDVIRSEPMTYYIDPLKLIQPDAEATRIMYQSTDTHGEPMAVTGVLLVPNGEYTGPGDTRPIIGYAAGTQGLADHCAPSRQAAEGQEYESIFISGLLAAGYAVVMTDYEGLGTPGVHTYMNRASQGHAVLDSVRAAQRLDGSGLSSDGPVAIAGYSQGGGASAAAAELAPSYAPELDVKGAIAGAVPADLGRVGENLDGGLYTLFLGYAIAGMESAYDLDLSPYVNEQGEQYLAGVKDTCVFDLFEYSFIDSSTLTESGQPLTALFDEEPFKSILADNKLGTVAPDVPVLVVHSLADDVIPYDVGRDMAESWCDKGADVYFHTSLIPTHVGGAVPTFAGELIFLEQRFNDRWFYSNCWLL